MPDSFEKKAKNLPIEKEKEVLEGGVLDPEKMSEVLSGLETQIASGPGEVEKQGEKLLSSGLASIQSDTSGVFEQGRNILNKFKQKTESLAAHYGKLKSLLLVPFVVSTLEAESQSPGTEIQNAHPEAKIIVHDKNDPRLRRYEDSLSAYKFSVAFKKFIEQNKKLSSSVNSSTPLYMIDWQLYNKKFPGISINDVWHIKGINAELENTGYRFDVIGAPVNIGTFQGLPEYRKPKQKVVYEKDEEMQSVEPKSNLLKEGVKSDSLNVDMQMRPLFKEGTYFTRERQAQELQSDQFNNEVLVDFFDKKSGKLLGTYSKKQIQ